MNTTGLASAPGPIRSEFGNLLVAAQLSCHAVVALLAFPGADGKWTTESYGLSRSGPFVDRELLDAVGSSPRPIEITNLLLDSRWNTSLLANSPARISYFYGIPLRAGNTLLGTVCILDRRTIGLSDRERRGLTVVTDKIVDRMYTRSRIGASKTPGGRSCRVPPSK